MDFICFAVFLFVPNCEIFKTVFPAIGNDRLALWVAGFNTNAQGFYRHIGFHETGLTQTEDMGPELEMINYSDGVFQ